MRSDKSGDARGMSRRELAAAALAGGVAAAAGASRGDATGVPVLSLPTGGCGIAETSLAELQVALMLGKVTSRTLCEGYLARIAAAEPTLRAVIETNPDALAIADALDLERRERGARGPLHGIPVLIKDNIATGDRMETTAGSLALVGAKPKADAAVAARLRVAGAILLGKTNLSEWANFRSTQSSSGWSARGGQCRNPYALDRSPCGSSSGTGAAIAASLAAVGVGTETDGSIVCPAHACGLVGIKPTVGLVSRAGIVPIAHSQDTAGPMARSVADAAALLSALAGEDPRDPATADARGRIEPDYTRFLDRQALKGARLGVPRKVFFGYSPEADRIVEEAIGEMARRGAVIVDPADIPNAGEYDGDEYEVLLHEFKADLDAYLAGLDATAAVRTLADLIAFNERHAERELAYFGQEHFVAAQAKGPLTDPAYRKARERCVSLSREKGLDAVFEAHRLDALVAPTGGPPWPIDLVNGDHFLGSSSTPAAVSGYPSITVPAGQSFGLPVGVTFIGRRFAEGPLIALAYAFERATRRRQPPRYLATAQL